MGGGRRDGLVGMGWGGMDGMRYLDRAGCGGRMGRFFWRGGEEGCIAEVGCWSRMGMLFIEEYSQVFLVLVLLLGLWLGVLVVCWMVLAQV